MQLTLTLTLQLSQHFVFHKMYGRLTWTMLDVNIAGVTFGQHCELTFYISCVFKLCVNTLRLQNPRDSKAGLALVALK